MPPAAVRDGPVALTPDGHRITAVAQVDGVTHVKDSKATNAHAAAASLVAFDRVVWVAGGLAVGADFDDPVQQAAPPLRAVMLLALDVMVIADAVATRPRCPRGGGGEQRDWSDG